MRYIFTEGGLPNELAALTDHEVVLHLRNYLGNFILDPAVCSVYVNRLAAIPPQHYTDSLREWALYLLGKYARLNPMDEQANTLWGNASGNPVPYLRELSKCRPPDNVTGWLKTSSWNFEPEQVRSRLLNSFRSYPFAPPILARLIENDLQLNIPIGEEWRKDVRLPSALITLLDWMIVEASHLQGRTDHALHLLNSIPSQTDNEFWLNAAAEIHARSGDRQKAAALYMASLRIDPWQSPIHYRLNELANPFKPDNTMLSTRTAIFLYSWNKCDLLANTLRSLAVSEIGAATITVLLNGCTDNSSTMLAALNQELFDGRISIIDLPINIGAPAARNWLLATKEGREAEYVAFLDDDVDVPTNWLASLLTALRDTPDAGVAGAKILNPGSPNRLQYLFRNIAVAREGMIRLSLDTPNRNYDSGLYDFVRLTDNVMGCCHVFTRAALDAVPLFDIRFSPSQMDDIAHDIDLRLHGFNVVYCGLVTCCHHQMSGMGRATPKTLVRFGNVIGNDVKFFYKYIERLDQLATMNNLVVRLATQKP